MKKLLKGLFFKKKSEGNAFTAWESMRRNSTTNDIEIVNTWVHFDNFYEDMGDKPKGKHLGRIFTGEGFCKRNCKWMTRKEIANKRENCVNITYKGETLNLRQWGERLGIGDCTMKYRLDQGYPIEKVFSTEKLYRKAKSTK